MTRCGSQDDRDLWLRAGIESAEESVALRAKLQKQGYDGIHLADIGQWIAFEPGQIKSASENVGAFDRGNADIRFSFAPKVGEAEAYRAALSKLVADRRTTVPAIRVSETPSILQHFGAPDLPITIERDVVRKATNGVRHRVPMAVMERLPELLADPAAVFASRKPEGGFAVVLDAKEPGTGNVMIALHLQRHQDRVVVNRIASAYGRPDGQYQAWTREGLLRYVADKKNPDLVRLVGLQLPVSGSPDRGFGATVLSRDDIVKPEQGSANVRFSLRPVAAAGPSEALADIEAVMNAGSDRSLLQKAKAALQDLTPGKVKDALRSIWLGALTTDMLTELGADYHANMGLYSEFLKQMGADRNQLQQDGDELAEAWRQWAAKHPAEAKELHRLMHDSTIDGVDPSKDARQIAPRSSRPRIWLPGSARSRP